MKIRESGKPEEKIWEGFFNPVKILETLGMRKNICNVAEFGCGFDTFTTRFVFSRTFDLKPYHYGITLKK